VRSEAHVLGAVAVDDDVARREGIAGGQARGHRVVADHAEGARGDRGVVGRGGLADGSEKNGRGQGLGKRRHVFPQK
jgi:hypothetical protein